LVKGGRFGRFKSCLLLKVLGQKRLGLAD